MIQRLRECTLVGGLHNHARITDDNPVSAWFQRHAIGFRIVGGTAGRQNLLRAKGHSLDPLNARAYAHRDVKILLEVAGRETHKIGCVRRQRDDKAILHDKLVRRRLRRRIAPSAFMDDIKPFAEVVGLLAVFTTHADHRKAGHHRQRDNLFHAPDYTIIC